MRWQDTPVYIVNRNNLERGFRDLVRWLIRAGMTDINVIDNQSTLPELLDFYHVMRPPLMVQRHILNLGPYAFWELDLHKTMHERFIVTDPDVVPSHDCPDDLIEKMHYIMDQGDKVGKVGPSLRIDNLPDHYARKTDVIKWEQQFWQLQVPHWQAYYADIDTTMALYQPHSVCRPAGQTLRLAPPYSVEHRPWYEDSSSPSDEHKFYHQNAQPDLVHW